MGVNILGMVWGEGFVWVSAAGNALLEIVYVECVAFGDDDWLDVWDFIVLL